MVLTRDDFIPKVTKKATDINFIIQPMSDINIFGW